MVQKKIFDFIENNKIKDIPVNESGVYELNFEKCKHDLYSIEGIGDVTVKTVWKNKQGANEIDWWIQGIFLNQVINLLTNYRKFWDIKSIK